MWEKNSRKYYKLLESISDRIDEKTYKYFSQSGFHDFRLKKLELIHNEYGENPVLQVKIFVTDWHNTLEIFFENVKKFEVKSVENDDWNRDDWGYDEILPVDDETLSFEVLFASGASFFITFPNKSLKIIGEIIEEKKDSLVYYEIGDDHFNKGHIREAIGSFKKSLELEKHFKTYEKLYYCHCELGETEEANRCIEQAYILKNNSDRTAYLYANSLISKGDILRAKEVLRKLLSRNTSYKKAKIVLDSIEQQT